MNEEPTKTNHVVCPCCTGDGYVELLDATGSSRAEKCPVCCGRAILDLERLRYALMRLSSRFPPRRFRARYVRRRSGHGTFVRFLAKVLGSRASGKPASRKTPSPGKIPASGTRYRKWFQARMTRLGITYWRPAPPKARTTLHGTKAFWNRGQRRG